MSNLKSISYESMLTDLNSIPLNATDFLFEVFSSSQHSQKQDNVSTELNELNAKLEKYILFKSNSIDTLKSDDISSLNNLNNEFESLETRLNSLQHFIDVSKKFFNQ